MKSRIGNRQGYLQPCKTLPQADSQMAQRVSLLTAVFCKYPYSLSEKGACYWERVSNLAKEDVSNDRAGKMLRQH